MRVRRGRRRLQLAAPARKVKNELLHSTTRAYDDIDLLVQQQLEIRLDVCPESDHGRPRATQLGGERLSFVPSLMVNLWEGSPT